MVTMCLHCVAKLIRNVVAVQSLSRVWLFATPWTAARQASPSITDSRSLLKLMSIESVMPSNYLIFCHSLFHLPSIFPSIRVFSNESVLQIRWLKYWGFSFSISPSNEYSGLISFRTDRLDLLAVQGTLKSLIQHHGSKASYTHCQSCCPRSQWTRSFLQAGDWWAWLHGVGRVNATVNQWKANWSPNAT